MNRPLILKRFKDIGLSSNEAKSYLCLLQRHTLTVPEVSKLAAIPPPNAYRSLEKLMSKGLCISKPGPTKKYSASDPSSLEDKFLRQVDEAIEIELENLKEKLNHGLKEKEKEVSQKKRAAKENIKSLITELRPQYEKSRLETNPLDYIEIIKDPYQIHKRFMQLVAEAKEEILGFTKPPYTVPKGGLKEQAEQQLQLIKKALKVRSILEVPKDKEIMEWFNAYITEGAKYGEQMRVMEELPMKMVIFDSKVAMFALPDPITGRMSVTSQIVAHPGLAQSLKILFETLWQQAEDYQILGDSRR